jgi:A/G-specific adenine glycosylase
MPKDSLASIAQPLLRWYKKNARRLPWRDTPSPYRTLVSEFMLQQTRVEAAISYFDRFTAALPDVRSLADADEQTLFKLWEGLGYYSRARNLQKAAQMIVEEYGGEIPASYDSLLRLPGVGPYTAGAVASIAFGIPHPAVDGNVLRVVSRLTASRQNISEPLVRRAMAQSIQKIIPSSRAGDFNQALMELGALICLPGEPKCAACPLSFCCAGYAKGIAAALPRKQKKPPRKIMEKTFFVLTAAGRLALIRRPEGGLLAGLWSLPSADGALPPGEAKKELEKQGIRVEALTLLPQAKHIFTHVEWRMQGFAATLPVVPENGLFTWVSEPELKSAYPLPSAYRFYLKYFLKTK